MVTRCAIQLTINPFLQIPDPGHYCHFRGGPDYQSCQGRAAALVPDEDGWLQQRQRQELHHLLEGWSRLQRHHSQASVRHFIHRLAD